MSKEEKNYLEEIEDIIEHFAQIQKKLVMDQKGIQAIVELMKEFSDSKYDLTNKKDPIVEKARNAALDVINQLTIQLKRLEKLTPTSDWKAFHNVFVKSIKLQLEGYKEMYKAFEDNNPLHVKMGLKLVNEGMNILEAGSKMV